MCWHLKMKQKRVSSFVFLHSLAEDRHLSSCAAMSSGSAKLTSKVLIKKERLSPPRQAVQPKPKSPIYISTSPPREASTRVSTPSEDSWQHIPIPSSPAQDATSGSSQGMEAPASDVMSLVPEPVEVPEGSATPQPDLDSQPNFGFGIC